MTYNILKANAIPRRNFRTKKDYMLIAQLCEDRNNTAGLVYRLQDVLGFYEEYDALPGAVEQATPSSLADAVDRIYTHYKDVLCIVEAKFPSETPETIRHNYLLYELWAIRAHANVIASDLSHEEQLCCSK
jgi:hypothetical protein